MTRLLLEVPQSQDLHSLLALFERLNLRVVQKSETPQPAETGTSNQLNPLKDAEQWASIVRPLRQSQSIEDMVREQRYKGFDRVEFDRLIEALDVQDSEDQLLKLLRA